MEEIKQLSQVQQREKILKFGSSADIFICILLYLLKLTLFQRAEIVCFVVITEAVIMS